MWIEVGHFCLILSVFTAIIGSVAGFSGGCRTTHNGLSSLVKTQSLLTLLLVGLALLSLIWSFINDDFSVRYVAAHSNRLLPLFYKIAATWGGHEGSLLLWLFFSYVWLGVLLPSLKRLSGDVQNYTVAIILAVSVGFALFVLLTSNPFTRQFPIPSDGVDLNPLLQHPGLALHPPMLYLGYVGFSIVFSMTLAALMAKKFDTVWAEMARWWTLMAWICLTLGIVLGSMWAYRELGWGGWWFWDPVENASFMPWLVGTALLHSLMVAEKRAMFQHWTVLLAISTFSLSLIGMFLVRSGVLISVHAFVSNSNRGIVMLIYLSVVLLTSLTLYVFRAQSLYTPARFPLVSREMLLLINNILLITACVTVLLGTLFPLISDILQIGKFSVGAPYFNQVLMPIWSLLLCVLIPAARIGWNKNPVAKMKKSWLVSIIVSSGLSVGLIVTLGKWAWVPMLIFTLSCTVILTHLHDLYRRSFRQPQKRWGMTVAHIGLALFAIGATAVSYYDGARDIVIKPRESILIGTESLTFVHLEGKTAQNYEAMVGHFLLSRNGKDIAMLKPEKRQYFSGGAPMTEADILHSFTRDFYISLGEMQGVDPSTAPWLIRVYIKPLMNWLWVGCILMVLGGILVLTDRKNRIKT
ncbi:heme lyase CcmF/NrfE family subunit [Neisseria iguanae]|uniref:C-type cytochrome biogenesis protein CcmF n=1 Tax=Neisseria iguanae TaxID=90242 RepID=A0A2P7U0D7_9NEIS|nr:heme lyase CcmF/NrfE family subunit [Neisseria iguanae]PSJ80442.1 c-type cytochrome biogenesis protein CcmF [Neisseria iguanae]